MLKKIFSILSISSICFISAVVGYSIYEPINDEPKDTINEASIDILNKNENLTHADELDEGLEVSNVNKSKIIPSTKMTYEYVYKEDNITEIFEDVPPYFLLNLTREEFEKNFQEWNIKSFSKEEVVLQKILDGESIQHYIIGEYDGNIAVFYKNAIDGENLKEITSTPIESLSESEQQLIKNGIEIVGKEELMKFLENYGS